MFRSHVIRVTAVLLLTLALGALAVPAQAAGFSPERSSRWEQLAEVFFGWILKTSSCIEPNGGAALCRPGGNASSAGLKDSSMIDPNGKAGTATSPGTAALCLDTTACIDPLGRN